MIECHPKQKEFIDSKKPYAAYIGGVGSGKTFGAAIWALQQAFEHPSVTGFVAANTYDQLNKAMMKDIFTLLTMMNVGYVFNKRPPSNWPNPTKHKVERFDKILTIENGAQIYCFSMENYDAIRGIEFGWAALDEARDMHEDAFMVVQTRLRGFGEFNYQIKMSTTPCGYNWIYYKFIDKESDIYLPESEVFFSSTKDNPYNPKYYYDSLKAGMSKEDVEQELEAQFIEKGTGSVFAFSRARHTHSLEPTTEDNILVAIDFNVAPLCATMAFIREEKLYFFDEVYISNNGQVKNLCIEILDRLNKMKHTGVVEVDADLAGQNRTVVTLKTSFDLIREYLCEPLGDRAHSYLGVHRERSVYVGAQKCNALLDPKLGNPKMFFSLKCRNTIRDMERLIWIPGTDQIDKSNKVLSHMADNVRYTATRKFDELAHGGILRAFWGQTA